MNIQNPHDTFFREVFTDTQKARELISLALPPQVTSLFDWKKFVHESGTFIDEAMREHHSDILFSTGLIKGDRIKIYILFEHKSYHDIHLFTQLLRYLTQIYTKMKELTPVIPLVFYHGTGKWKVPETFFDDFRLPREMKPVFRRYIPDFRYELINLQSRNIDDMIIPLTMKVLLYTFKHIRHFQDEGILERFIVLSKDLFFEESGLKIIEKMPLYLFTVNDIQPEKVRDSIDRLISADKGDIAMTTAERLIQQGIEKGMEKGLKKGILNGKKETALNMLRRGYSREDIADITGLPVEEIDKLK